jgi:hypothetical protein
MDPEYYALVEMGFTAVVVLGFVFWQLRSVNRELRKGDAERERAATAAGERSDSA